MRTDAKGQMGKKSRTSPSHHQRKRRGGGGIHSGGIQRANIFPKWRGGFYAEAKGEAYEYFIMFALDSSAAAGIDCVLRVRKALPGQRLEILCLSPRSKLPGGS